MGVLQSLPLTAYIKMVDIWILGMMLYPFFKVVLLTVKEILDKSEEQTKIKPTNSSNWTKDKKWSLGVIIFLHDWGLLWLLGIFMIVYWVAGIINLLHPDIQSIC